MSIIKFLSNSETFNGFVFQGCYTMDGDTLHSLYLYYKRTGENLLDIYSNFIYLLWDADDDVHGYYKTPDQYVIERSGLSKLRKLGIVDPDDLRTARVQLRKHLIGYYDEQERILQTRRREATKYTKQKKVKDYVFGKYGEKCRKCGSESKITIDHIIPISKEGKDELSNLQPLCASCNSSKGVGSNKKFMSLKS